MIEQIAWLSTGIAAVLEYFKQPVLKPLAARFNLSDFQYSAMLYVLVGLMAAVVVFTQPAQWDFLRAAGVFGYPRVVGNLLAIVALAGGNGVAHATWEFVKRVGGVSEPDPE